MVIWYQVFLSNAIFANRSIWLIDRTLLGSMTQGQSRPKINGDEGVFHTPKNIRTGTSPPATFSCHSQKKIWGVGGVWEYYLSVVDTVKIFKALPIGQGLFWRNLTLNSLLNSVSLLFEHTL